LELGELIDALRNLRPAADAGRRREEPEWLFNEEYGRYVVSRRLPGFTLLDNPPSGPEYPVASGIDGSSRLLYFSRGVVAVASVTLFRRIRGIHLYYTYPDIPGASSGKPPDLGVAVAAYQPSPPSAPEIRGLVRFRPPSYSWSSLPGIVRDSLYRYDAGYSSKMMESELRMLQENAMLSWCNDNEGGEELVLIDGPLFSTPGIFERMDLLRRGERAERVRVYLES